MAVKQVTLAHSLIARHFGSKETPGTLCVRGHTVHHLQFRFARTKTRPVVLAPQQCALTQTAHVGGAERFGQSVTPVSCHSKLS